MNCPLQDGLRTPEPERTRLTGFVLLQDDGDEA